MSAFMCVECGESPLVANPTCSSPHEVAGVETKLQPVRRKFIMPDVKPKQKAARPPRWRGRTAVYLNKAGERYAIYHISASEKEAWTHPYDERCEACPQ